MSNKVYIGLIVLLGVLCGFLGYKVNQKTSEVEDKNSKLSEANTELENVKSSKSQVIFDLEKMSFSYDTLLKSDQLKDTLLFDQKAEIDNLLRRVRNGQANLAEANAQIETMRWIMKGYLHKIDSLNTLNSSNQAQIAGLQTDINSISSERDQLQNYSDSLSGTLAVGSVLQAIAINAVPLQDKSDGSYREAPRNKASKTDQIRTNFTLLKNPIAPPGNKQIYVRIIKPDGTILNAHKLSGSAMFDGKMGPYSIKRTIDYNNEETDLSVYYKTAATDNLVKGDYKILIYQDDKKIGQTSLALR